MNADLDRLQGGFKINRFSIEPMILILNTFFQQNSICEKDNTDYIFSVEFPEKNVSRDTEFHEVSFKLGPDILFS